MWRTLCKGKIHRATVTEANLHYQGSVTIDKTLLQAADIMAYEQVHLINVTNGHRLITYAIEGEADSGVVCANGGGARLMYPGDIVIIIAYAQYDEKSLRQFKPHVVFVDEKNRIIPHSVKAPIELPMHADY